MTFPTAQEVQRFLVATPQAPFPAGWEINQLGQVLVRATDSSFAVRTQNNGTAVPRSFSAVEFANVKGPLDLSRVAFPADGLVRIRNCSNVTGLSLGKGEAAGPETLLISNSSMTGLKLHKDIKTLALDDGAQVEGLEVGPGVRVGSFLAAPKLRYQVSEHDPERLELRYEDGGNYRSGGTVPERPRIKWRSVDPLARIGLPPDALPNAHMTGWENVCVFSILTPESVTRVGRWINPSEIEGMLRTQAGLANKNITVVGGMFEAPRMPWNLDGAGPADGGRQAVVARALKFFGDVVGLSPSAYDRLIAPVATNASDLVRALRDAGMGFFRTLRPTDKPTHTRPVTSLSTVAMNMTQLDALLGPSAEPGKTNDLTAVVLPAGCYGLPPGCLLVVNRGYLGADGKLGGSVVQMNRNGSGYTQVQVPFSDALRGALWQAFGFPEIWVERNRLDLAGSPDVVGALAALKFNGKTVTMAVSGTDSPSVSSRSVSLSPSNCPNRARTAEASPSLSPPNEVASQPFSPADPAVGWWIGLGAGMLAVACLVFHFRHRFAQRLAARQVGAGGPGEVVVGNPLGGVGADADAGTPKEDQPATRAGDPNSNPQYQVVLRELGKQSRSSPVQGMGMGMA